jgi:hypothetical protein
MDPQRFYRPTGRGLEARIAERLEHLRALDAQARQAGAARDGGADKGRKRKT